jgi:hypothetical protein
VKKFTGLAALWVGEKGETIEKSAGLSGGESGRPLGLWVVREGVEIMASSGSEENGWGLGMTGGTGL